MRLSVVVPVYNMEKDDKLKHCMDSLINQTISDYEIIAVDDKSTDNSLEILKKYEKEYPDKVKVVASDENRRQGGAKNLGMRHANGEWLGFIDSDDWVTNDYYEKLLNKAEETGADIVSCRYTTVNKYTFEVGEIPENDSASYVGEMDWEKHARAVLSPGSMVLKIYKKSIFDDNGLWFPEGMFYEDNCVGELVMMYCKHFEFVDEPNYFYYINPASTTHSVTKEKCDDRLDTMTYLMEECFKREFLEEYPEELEYRFTDIFYINTMFSYMREVPFFKRRISYLRLLREGILSCFPDFDTNPYFEELKDEEVKRLAIMNVCSPFKFYWYYTFLCLYRKIRYGKY